LKPLLLREKLCFAQSLFLISHTLPNLLFPFLATSIYIPGGKQHCYFGEGRQMVYLLTIPSSCGRQLSVPQCIENAQPRIVWCAARGL
jgi:hypothetical protein